MLPISIWVLLQKAAMHVKRYLVQGQVDTRLSDGLELIFPHEVDDVVIAGMGGEVIAGIIGKAPWLKNKDKHLILQPMSSAEELRSFLAKEGYAVQEEKAVIADGRVYSVMRAEYLPEQVPKRPLYPYIGLLDGSTQESRIYIQRERNHLNKKAEGLQAAGRSRRRNRSSHWYRHWMISWRNILVKKRKENRYDNSKTDFSISQPNRSL